MQRLYNISFSTISGETIRSVFHKSKQTFSGCCSVGGAVAYDIRGPQFESIHRQKFIFIEHLFTVGCVLKRQK